MSLCWRQNPHSASWTGTNLSKNFRLSSGNISSVQCWPMTALMSSWRLPEALMASFAPFLSSQLCLSPKAASQAAQRMSETGRWGSIESQKVTRMKVSSHIIRSKFRAVELYFLKCLGALRVELLSPLSRWSSFSISRRMKERKPLCPGKVSLLLRMMATLSCTSEKATPRKEFRAEKTKQNWSRMAQKGYIKTSFSITQQSTKIYNCRITNSSQNLSRFSPCIIIAYRWEVSWMNGNHVKMYFSNFFSRFRTTSSLTLLSSCSLFNWEYACSIFSISSATSSSSWVARRKFQQPSTTCVSNYSRLAALFSVSFSSNVCQFTPPVLPCVLPSPSTRLAF